MSDIKKIRRFLKKIDEEYENNPNRVKQLEEYRRKYGTLTWVDMYRPFTI